MRIAAKLIAGFLVALLFLTGLYILLPALMNATRSWFGGNSLALFIISLLSFGLLIFLISKLGELMKKN